MKVWTSIVAVEANRTVMCPSFALVKVNTSHVVTVFMVIIDVTNIIMLLAKDEPSSTLTGKGTICVKARTSILVHVTHFAFDCILTLVSVYTLTLYIDFKAVDTRLAGVTTITIYAPF